MTSSAERFRESTVTPLPGALGVEDLVRRAQRGERWAKERLYRSSVRDATRVATFILGRSADVEDVVHDAFLRAFERLDQLEEGGAFGGWLARITANLARTRLRRRSLRRALWLDRDGEDIALERLAATSASPEQRAELSLIARALAELSPDARTAWVLRRVEGWSLGEVASTMSVSLATAKRRVAEAEAVVARHVDREDRR